jgi:hypothetical protein
LAADASIALDATRSPKRLPLAMHLSSRDHDRTAAGHGNRYRLT